MAYGKEWLIAIIVLTFLVLVAWVAANYDRWEYLLVDQGNADAPDSVLLASCEDGDAIACNTLGQNFRDGTGDVHIHDREAARFFRLSCDLDYPDGCQGLGSAYYNGKGVRQSYRQARAHGQVIVMRGALKLQELEPRNAMREIMLVGR